jgi:hypothetical protein
MTTSSGYPTVQLTSSLLLQGPVSASSFQILQAIDDPVAKTVNALVQVGPKGSNNWYYVWSGASYDAIGDWTDQELANAVQYQVVQQYPLNPYTT